MFLAPSLHLQLAIGITLSSWPLLLASSTNTWIVLGFIIGLGGDCFAPLFPDLYQALADSQPWSQFRQGLAQAASSDHYYAKVSPSSGKRLIVVIILLSAIKAWAKLAIMTWILPKCHQGLNQAGNHSHWVPPKFPQRLRQPGNCGQGH